MLEDASEMDVASLEDYETNIKVGGFALAA